MVFNKKTFFILICLLIPSAFSNAFKIENINPEIKNDFMLKPAKVEVFIEAGDSKTRELTITNRTNNKLNFKIEVEDFLGTQDPNQTVLLLGKEKSVYSLKEYLSPQINSFSLESGQKITLPIYINIPEDFSPGGRYATVLISSQANPKQGASATVISRLGALFFVEVGGEIKREGRLDSFVKTETDSKTKDTGFELLFENTGDVHLTPQGYIKIFNWKGEKIDEIEIPAFFVMPDSTRYLRVDWNEKELFGKYRAIVYLDKGFGEKLEELSLDFWVLGKSVFFWVFGLLLTILIILFVFLQYNKKYNEF